MAERSTARPADGAAQDDDPNEIDSWIAHLSRPAASDSDRYDEWSEAAAPQWREEVSDPDEESYQPEGTNQEHDARQARHRADQQSEEYEQYDGAYGRDEYAYRGFDPGFDPAPAGYEPDQAYRGDGHEHASWEERRAEAPYGPIDPGPVREDAHVGLQETYVVPEVGYAHEEHYPHDDDAGLNEDRYGGSAPQHPEAAEDALTQVLHNLECDARPRPAGRRRWLIAVGGLAAGALVCAVAFAWGSGGPPESALPVVAATIPPDASEEPIALPEMPTETPSSATPRSPSATPRTTPKATRSPSAAPSVTRPAAPPPTRAAATPTQTRSPTPLLLGPSSNDGVANMAQGYCDRHAAGSSAQPRNDGSWQCTRLLSASTIDMNVACRNTYGSDAYARTSNSGDPYAWRCYR
ncbi:hypothetical protein ONA91_39200 [Micromonospora sp. DR5-3]|uniref:hypothetical protein n=1 Tax=unclassified Micromonospora TaxID=2617518 RepID=UPI0011D648FD|nr:MULTISPECIES: hypothetical protein [unclassified Micromonospora]MCW3820476.1 hypothetical protein [Micromonospora sp. DR5-3]TYC14945.1 hypothetical protein FXF52_39555 [Micromonospora sp. MP36]